MGYRYATRYRNHIYTETTKSWLEELEMRQKALIETIEIEEINAKLVHDAGFPDFYKKYLNADLENPELREEILDYFIDKIYVDDDGNLSFVIKRYGKDGTKLVEMSADELIENQGFTRFDNFTLCSTKAGNLEIQGSRFLCFRRISLNGYIFSP